MGSFGDKDRRTETRSGRNAMSSLRQNAARRLNGQKWSTGPKPEAGKARSRANALKHGLSGAGVVTTPELRELFEERRYFLGAEVDRQDEHTERFENEAVFASLRVDACRNALRRRLSLQWDNDRMAAVVKRAEELPIHPELTSIELERTAHGVAWKLQRWAFLADALEAHGAWTADE